ncbi:MAG: tRNA (guanine(26)-N(2))-dimethyltransferase [Sulfolobales archaeon]|nr:tRNA (guanine(26)-N(2))-dimethyltransferase [Sulfolobales archaeon]
MKLREIREGEVKLLIPDPSEYSKEGRFDPSWAPVFYNPRMKFNRDVSVAFLKAVKPRSAIDGMSASGVRALRYKIESGVERVIANDKDPNAVELIRKNVELNKVDVPVYNKDVNALLYEERAEFVDIDPFGTPAPFLMSALWSSVRYLGITATDLTALECSSASSARRKYDLTCFGKVSFSKEFGLRALIGRIVRDAAALEKGVIPLLSFYKDYYYRVFVEVRRGSGKANEALKNLGFYYECPKCGLRIKSEEACRLFCPVCKVPMKGGGPIWLGSLGDQEVITKVSENVSDERERKFLEVLRAELIYNDPYYNTDFLASTNRTRPKKVTEMIECLGSAARTHFDPKGFKTNKPPEKVKECLGLWRAGS